MLLNHHNVKRSIFKLIIIEVLQIGSVDVITIAISGVAPCRRRKIAEFHSSQVYKDATT